MDVNIHIGLPYPGRFESAWADEIFAKDPLVASNTVSRVLLCVEKLLECLVATVLFFGSFDFMKQPTNLVAVRLHLQANRK